MDIDAGLASLFSGAGTGDPNLDAALGLQPLTDEEIAALTAQQTLPPLPPTQAHQTQAPPYPVQNQGASPLGGAPSPYDDMIARIASAKGLDPNLVKAMMRQESTFNPRARSNKDAAGLMQVIPSTFNRFKARPDADRYNPEDSIEAGTNYLAYLNNMFHGDPRLVVAAYNAGEGAVQKYGNQIPPYKETQNYVHKVLGYYDQFSNGQAPQVGSGHTAQSQAPELDMSKFRAVPMSNGEQWAVEKDMTDEEVAARAKSEGLNIVPLRAFQAPNGETIGVDFDMSDDEALALLQKQAPEAAVKPGMPVPDRSSYTRAFASNFLQAGGSEIAGLGQEVSRLGGAEFINGYLPEFGAWLQSKGDEAAAYGQKLKTRAEGMYQRPRDEDMGVMEEWFTRPVVEGAGNLLAYAIPYSTPGVGMLAGTAGIYGSAMDSLKSRAEREGKKFDPEEARPYALADTAANLIGIKMLGPLKNVLGKEAVMGSRAAILKEAEEKGLDAAKAYVGSKLGNIAKQVGITAPAFMGGEVAEQVIERAYAGLPLMDAEALSEYGAVMKQTAPLGFVSGVFKGAGAWHVKATEVERLKEQQAQAQALQEQAAAEQQIIGETKKTQTEQDQKTQEKRAAEIANLPPEQQQAIQELAPQMGFRNAFVYVTGGEEITEEVAPEQPAPQLETQPPAPGTITRDQINTWSQSKQFQNVLARQFEGKSADDPEVQQKIFEIASNPKANVTQDFYAFAEPIGQKLGDKTPPATPEITLAEPNPLTPEVPNVTTNQSAVATGDRGIASDVPAVGERTGRLEGDASSRGIVPDVSQSDTQTASAVGSAIPGMALEETKTEPTETKTPPAPRTLKDIGIEWMGLKEQLDLDKKEVARVTNPQAKQELLAQITETKLKIKALEDEAQPLVGKAPKNITIKEQQAWHGSPHDHDKFKSEYIGTGEGAQAFGDGLYFTDAREIAEWYKKKLSTGYRDTKGNIKHYGDAFETAYRAALETGPNIRPDYARAIARAVQDWVDSGKKAPAYLRSHAVESSLKPAYQAAIAVFNDLTPNKGRLYQVELAPQEDEYLDWYKPLKQQSAKVKEALAADVMRYGFSPNASGMHIYESLGGTGKESSAYLLSLGIRGTRYPAKGQLDVKPGDPYNYVIFDENDVAITAKYNRAKNIVANPDKGIRPVKAEDYADIKDTRGLVQRYAEKGTDPELLELAKIINASPHLGSVPVQWVKQGSNPHSDVTAAFNKGANALVAWEKGAGPKMYIRTDIPMREDVLVHEAVHAVTEGAIRRNPAVAEELRKIARQVGASLARNTQLADFWKNTVKSDPGELLAYGLTSPSFREVLKTYGADGKPLSAYRTPEEEDALRVNPNKPSRRFREDAPKPLTLWDKFVDAMARIFGLPPKRRQEFQRRLNEYLDRKAQYEQQVKDYNTLRPLQEKLDQAFKAFLRDTSKRGVDIDEDVVQQAFEHDKIKGTVGWTPERVDRLLDEFGYMDGRTKGFAAWVSPSDFIEATSSSAWRQELKKEKTPLDRKKLAEQTQPIFLEIAPVKGANDVWRIVGHEGRHRMMALEDEGATQVPVVLRLPYGSNWEGAKRLFLTAQEFGNGEKGTKDMFARSVTPLTYGNKDKIIQEFVKSSYGVPEPFIDIKFAHDTVETNLKESGLAANPKKQSFWTKLAETKRDILTEGRKTSIATEYVDARAGLRKGLEKGQSVMNGKLRGDLIYSAHEQRGNVIQESMHSGYTVANSDGTIGVVDAPPLAPVNIFRDVAAYKGDPNPTELFNNMLVALRGKTIRAKDAEIRSRAIDLLSKAEQLTNWAKKTKDKTKATQYRKAAKSITRIAERDLRNINYEAGRTWVTDEQVAWAEEVAKKHPTLMQYADRLRELMRTRVNLWHEAGLITEEQRKEFNDYEGYIPLYKTEEYDEKMARPELYVEDIISQMGRGSNTMSNIKAQKHHAHEIFVEGNILRHIGFMDSAASENMARRYTCEQLAIFGEAEKVADAIPGQTVMFRKDGEQVFYKVRDPDVYHAFQAAAPLMSPLLKQLRKASNFARVTMIMNPLFWYRQLIREPLQASLVARVGIITPFDTIGAIARIAAGKAESYKTLKKRGVVGPVDVVSDPEKFLENIQGKKGLLASGFGAVKRIHEVVDAATRAVVFEKAVEEGKSMGMDQETAEGFATMKAREVINFSKQGRSRLVRSIRATTPFFGAALNSLDVLARMAAPQKLGKLSKAEAMEARRMFYSTAMMLATYTTAYTIAMSDDEDYLKSPDRLMNWMSPNPFPNKDESKFLLHAIPFEAGYFFKAIPELITLLNLGVITKREALKEAGKGFNDIVIPPLSFGYVFRPMIEALANYDFHTGSPLEAGADQRVAAKYKDHRASELTKAIVRKMDDMGIRPSGLSPDITEHLFKSYFSQLWAVTRTFADGFIRDAKGLPEAPEKNWSEWPMLGGVFSTDTKDRAVNDFYTIHNEFEALKTSLNAAKSRGSADKYESITTNPKEVEKIKAYEATKDIKDRLGEVHKRLERVMNDSSIDAKEKARRVHILKNQHNALAEEGMNRIRKLGFDQ